MKTYQNVSYGGNQPDEIEHAPDITIVNQGIVSRTETDEQGEEHTVWYVETQTHYKPQEYIAYLESVLESRQEETDELIAEILEGD